jgi:hypothetical protein
MHIFPHWGIRLSDHLVFFQFYFVNIISIGLWEKTLGRHPMHFPHIYEEDHLATT